MAPKNDDRRYAIAAAAIQLYSERGYDAVTAEDIAAQAGIGVRTFFRYFPTKEHAAFPDHEERVERFRAALQARSGTASPVDAVIEVGGGQRRRVLRTARPLPSAVPAGPQRACAARPRTRCRPVLPARDRGVPRQGAARRPRGRDGGHHRRGQPRRRRQRGARRLGSRRSTDTRALLDVAKEIVKRSARAALAAARPCLGFRPSGTPRAAAASCSSCQTTRPCGPRSPRSWSDIASGTADPDGLAPDHPRWQPMGTR